MRACAMNLVSYCGVVPRETGIHADEAAVNAESCQRWRNGRARYRPAGEVFETMRAGVHEIDELTAKAFVTGHHYSASYPAARFRAGLFVHERLRVERLVGVAVFSVPMSQGVIPHHFDPTQIARRMKSLRETAGVYDSGERRKTPTGRAAIVWKVDR